VAGAQIDINVGDMVIQAEAVAVTGTELTSGKTAKAAENVADAFQRAQDAIVQVARSTAQMIARTGSAARPDHVEVEFGLSFTAAGGVIMAGVAGQASLKVRLSWDAAGHPADSGDDEDAAGDVAEPGPGSSP
jgi:NTP-dependent ternary system trypsin peptidase co-occuring protein